MAGFVNPGARTLSAASAGGSNVTIRERLASEFVCAAQRPVTRPQVARGARMCAESRISPATSQSPGVTSAFANAQSHVMTILCGRASSEDCAIPSGDVVFDESGYNCSPRVVSIAVSVVRTFNGDVDTFRPLGERAMAIPVCLPEDVDITALRDALYEEGKRMNADVNLQPCKLWNGRKRLAVFDLDSTLIAQETIDEIAKEVGVAAEVRNITERAMNGEIGFRDALRERVALLRGLPEESLNVVKDRVKITEGAHKLISTLSKMGCETAVVSGGFEFLANHVKDELRMDYAFANRLEVGEDGCLTGYTEGRIVDAEFKASTLARLAEERNLDKEEVLAVGDGSNDIPMLSLAGLGIAFNAKPIVQRRAPARVNQDSLASVLYLLGMSDADIDQLSR